MTDRGTPAEVELKLLVPAGGRARLLRHPALQSPPERQRLLATYYDTAELALAGAGLTLRVRRNGKARVQTLKSRGDGQGAAARRGEWEWPVGADRPDFALVAGTPPGAALDPDLAARLEPLFVADIRRSVRRLALGGSVVEAALDEGSIRAGEAGQPVRELELELKEGPIGPLYQLALDLHGTVPMQIGTESKAARGLRLRTGGAVAVEKLAEPELDRHVRAGDGFRRIVLAALGGLLANRPAAEAGDVGGVHQMRVALRRLRAALVLFEPHLEPHAASRFEDESGRIGRVLGEARDWDVFCLETLPAALGGEAESGWQPLLGQAAEAARAAAHRSLREELAGPALTGLVLGLSAWVEQDPGAPGRDTLHRPLSALGPDLLDRLARKAGRRGRHIGRRSDEELHALRKSMKKLRYGADFLGGLYRGKAVHAYLKRCKALQELLGEINDAAAAVALAERLEVTDGTLVPAVGAVARWSSLRRRQAIRRLPAAWHDVRDASPFWR